MFDDSCYPLSQSTWSEREYAALSRVIRSGNFTMGAEVEQFEEEFAAKLGRRYAVMVNSGSSANLIATAALTFREAATLNEGDEVIVPAVSWSTTFYPFHQYGFKLKFVDVNPRTYNIDPEAARNAITPNTKMIVTVNLLGNSCDYKKLHAICRDHDLELFEDNCEALGARYESSNCGQFGLVSTHSLFYSHHISSMEGGVIVTDDEEMYQLCRSLRAHGWTRSVRTELIGRVRSSLARTDDFYDSFKFILPGYNVRPLELEAAVAREQLDRLDDLTSIRRNNARMMAEAVLESELIQIQEEIGSSSWFGFGFTVSPESPVNRDELVAALKQARIGVRPIVAGNFLRQPVTKLMNIDEDPSNFPGADILHFNGFFVGNEGVDLREQIAYFQKNVEALS
jgi:dTDP-4-amino-4,6-dideoxygalactose transaminase